MKYLKYEDIINQLTPNDIKLIMAAAKLYGHWTKFKNQNIMPDEPKQLTIAASKIIRGKLKRFHILEAMSILESNDQTKLIPPSAGEKE